MVISFCIAARSYKPPLLLDRHENETELSSSVMKEREKVRGKVQALSSSSVGPMRG